MQIVKKVSDSMSLLTAVALHSVLGLLRDEIEGHVLQGELAYGYLQARAHRCSISIL